MSENRDVQERLRPFVAAGRYGEALGVCAEAWQSDRDNPWLLLQMGRLYHRAGHLAQAEPFFRLACTLDPGDPEVQRHGEMFHRAKDLLPTSRTDIENFCSPDLILVQAPGWGVNTPPLGTAMLTSFARSRGFKVLPIDLNVEFYLQRPPEFNRAWDMEQSLWFWKTADLVQGILSAFHEKVEAFVDMVVATGAPAVGFSVYDSSALVSLELARMLKVGKNLSRGADVNAIAEAHGRTGLGATYNFMFGLPGETEEDAFEALEFIRRNRNAGLAVNPSAVFCGFSPGTLAHENPERYGIDMTKGGVYWESMDGENTYIRRLKRFEDFCRLVRELGISTTYPATVLLDRNRALGNYFAQSGDPVRAQWYYEAWLQEHPEDLEIRASLERTMRAIEEQALRAGSVQMLEEAACA